jgi:hypothetical protein
MPKFLFVRLALSPLQDFGELGFEQGRRSKRRPKGLGLDLASSYPYSGYDSMLSFLLFQLVQLLVL